MSNRAATRVFQGVEEQIATGQLKDGTKLDGGNVRMNLMDEFVKDTSKFIENNKKES